jgi:hypothetical protein
MLMYYYIPSCVHSVVALHRVHTYIVLLLRAKALRTHFVLFARNSIRYAHVLLYSIVYRDEHVRPKGPHVWAIFMSFAQKISRCRT